MKIVLFIHGMWGGKWYWDKYIEVFEKKGFICIAENLRYHNFGCPLDPRLGKVSVRDYADDMEVIARAIHHEYGVWPIVIGHSMGGLIAQMLAERQVVNMVVLLTPAPPAGIWTLEQSVLKSFWSGIKKFRFWAKPFKQTFDEAVYSMLHLLPMHEQREVYKKFVHESGRVCFEIGFWPLCFLRRPTKVNEKKIKRPMLIICALEDRITPPVVVKQIYDKYKKIDMSVEYKEYEGHAHWVVSQPGWRNIVKDILDFIEKNLTKALNSV